MSSDKFNPTRPEWDTSKDGSLPEELADDFAESGRIARQQSSEWEVFASLSPEERLARLDEKLEEAVQLADSRAAEFLTDEQRFINTWQKELKVATSSYRAYENPDLHVENREERITDCRRRTAIALYKLGHIDLALQFATPHPDLTEHIKNVQTAIDYDDGDLLNHICPRPEGEIDGKQIELDRRWETEQVMSEKHGCLVHVWKCNQCENLNATPEIPERQARYDAQMLATIHAAAKGDTLGARGIAKTLPQFEAGRLMGKNT